VPFVTCAGFLVIAAGNLAIESTAALEARIRDVVTNVADYPERAPRVEGRPGMRVVPLVRYPFKIFYRIFGDTVRIVHIRHATRRPWTEGT
jgi:toxin ParE1/3/4